MPEAQVSNALYFDNTRVSSFFKCPRSYYFRHVRHWRREGNKVALAFGGAMHSAMEVVWGKYREADPRVLLEKAMDAFSKKWLEEGFDPEIIDLSEKRNPGLAREILAAYLDQYHTWLRDIEILGIEQPFIIPVMRVDDGGETTYVHYIGRWDKVWREKKGFVFVGEHKTTSLYRTKTIFAKEWIESFSPDNQVDGYSYAAHAIYGSDCRGIMIDGIMVHKTVRGFTRIPIQRAMKNLDAWHWGIQYWINEIIENTKMLRTMEEASSGAPGTGDFDFDFMPAFPQRTEHCAHKYGQCEYLSVCKYLDSNPERIINPPDGFIYEEWDPFAHNVEEGQRPMIVGSGMEK
jgi:hypothetical protein